MQSNEELLEEVDEYRRRLKYLEEQEPIKPFGFTKNFDEWKAKCWRQEILWRLIEDRLLLVEHRNHAK